jgi:hypothetical protein
MRSPRRWTFSQLATVIATIAIFGSVATVALGGSGFLGGGGLVFLDSYGCLNGSAVRDMRAACDKLAEDSGYQTGVVQPLNGMSVFYNSTRLCFGVAPAVNNTTHY